MCMQCLVEAVEVYVNIIPGWSIVIATKDHPDWPKGFVGLTHMNDPVSIWEPLYFLCSEDESENISPEEKNYLGYIRYVDDKLSYSADDGYRLVTAAMQVGFNPNNERFTPWLLDRLSQHMLKDKK